MCVHGRVADADPETKAPAGDLVDEAGRLGVVVRVSRVDIDNRRAEQNRARDECQGFAEAQAITEPFDAVIVSGTSASWTATELFHWLQERSPETMKHVLFTFHSAPEADTKEFLHTKGITFLVKPFEVADLIVAARKLLVRKHAAVAGD